MGKFMVVFDRGCASFDRAADALKYANSLESMGKFCEFYVWKNPKEKVWKSREFMARIACTTK